jgi:hypothetical protein
MEYRVERGMSAPSIEMFLNQVKMAIESPDYYSFARIQSLLNKTPIEEQVPFIIRGLDEISKSSTLNYDIVKRLIDMFKTYLKTMTKSLLEYIPFTNKLNLMGVRTVHNFLPPSSKLPYNKAFKEDLPQFKKLYQQLNSKSISPSDPPAIQYIKKYLATEPFVVGVLSALSENDTEQVEYLLHKLPLQDIGVYIRALVDHILVNNTDEKNFAILLSNYLNTVSAQPGLNAEQQETLRNMARNLEVADPTSIVNPNLQRLVRYSSGKNRQRRFQNTKTQRNLPYQKIKNNFIAKLIKDRESENYIKRFKNAPLDYYKSNQFRTRRRRN